MTQEATDNIKAERLGKRFDHRMVVRDVSLQVKRGEIFGFVGPSGSGKTVTIRMLTGVYAPSSGTVTVLGETPSKFSRKARERIGYLPQQFTLFPNLSVMENMRFTASLYGMNPFMRRRHIRETLKFVELWDNRKQLASKLSGGMQRRLELASALAHDPELIFADEPTAGVDPILREHFWDNFQNLRDEGRTLFVTTQYVTEAKYCDRVALMSQGSIVAIGTPDQLRRQAFGGEAVDLQAQGLKQETVAALEKLNEVSRVEVLGFERIRVYAQDAGSLIPTIIGIVQQHGGRVGSVDEFQPNFDEVFVRLVENSRKDTADQRLETR